MPGALGLPSGLRFRRISALPPGSSRGTGSRGSGIHSMSPSLGDRADEARRIEGGSVRGEADQVVGLLEPHFADNRNDSALFFNKEYSRAVEQCRNALQSNPLFLQARFTLGLSLYRLERYREAMEEFDTLLRMDPGDKQAGKFRDAIQRKLKEEGEN